MQLKTAALFQFGPFLLHTGQHLLTRQGIPVPLTPKTYDLLLSLVANHDRIMLKEEMMKAVWPDAFVEESNLTQQVSAVRKALGEAAGEDRYIVTVPGRGYRFVAEVKSVDVNSPKSRRMLTPNRRFTLGAIGLTIGVLGGVYFLGPTHGRPRVLAILPFQNLKGDTENDFLGFSLADAVITRFGAVRSLTVRASSDVERYRNQSVHLRRAEAGLHVDTILTGTFLRDGDVLRITSQLVDVQNQKLIWKGAFDVRYDRLLIVQDNVAREIVEKLQLSLSPGEAASLEPKMAVDPLAYEYYLRGVDLYSRSEFPLAIKMLRKSADLDAGHALPWAPLGRALPASASFEFGGHDEYVQADVAYQKAL